MTIAVSTPLQRDRPAGPARRASELAIFGGPRAVRHHSPERWPVVSRRALKEICRVGRQGTNTRARGGEIAKFEKRFAELTQTEHALVMNSGTATLHSAYFAIGVGPGDEVIVPTYTFFASASPILQCGGTPVFCDIDERTLTADPDDVERRITDRTRAICVVHVWGNPARMDRFVEIARKHDLALIEDCSHAHGATYDGKPVGGWGDIGCFSLQGMKPVSGGELGVAVTRNPELYDRMLALGHFGRLVKDQAADTVDADLLSLGLKFRPHLFGVILAQASLEQLDELNRLRTSNYTLLSEAFSECGAVSPIDMYPQARRGGFLEFIFRYNAEHAGGWNVSAFAKAVNAEGVPIKVDRYTHQTPHAALLHELPLFSGQDRPRIAGHECQRGTANVQQEAAFPVAERMKDQLLSVSPFTLRTRRFMQECIEAVHKVSDIAAGCRDLRT